jgi:glycosyltransferase involved in cell wall biosynthesis
MRDKISTCITAFNEEEQISRCLESVSWTDEIVVVDSFSTDRTVEICRKYTDRVYRHEWLGYIGQKNLIKDMATHPWILFIDADEEVSPELKKEIVNELETPENKAYAGYAFPRMVYFLGKWIRHGDWYPDIKLRLFRKDHGKCAGVEPHDQVVVEGKVKQLRGNLFHYTYGNIDDHIAAVNKYSTLTAAGWRKEGKRFPLSHMVFRPPLRFLRCYLLRLGFLDGLRGLIIASTAAYGVFIKYAKLWAHYHDSGSICK